MRSEKEKRERAPITVQFGEQTYEIQILRITKSREWRAKLVEQLSLVLQNFQITTSDTKVLSRGLMCALLDFPEKLTDLVFAYAPDLPQEKILKEGTEEEVATAFSAVFEVAFPFVTQLGLVTQILQSERKG